MGCDFYLIETVCIEFKDGTSTLSQCSVRSCYYPPDDPEIDDWEKFKEEYQDKITPTSKTVYEAGAWVKPGYERFYAGYIKVPLELVSSVFVGYHTEDR